MQDYINNFLEITKDLEPRKFLLDALVYVEHKNKALDLGCGSFRDTKFLLKEGFSVVAVDKSSLVKKYFEPIKNKDVSLSVSSFSDYDYPEKYFDIVNAQYSLPFMEKRFFHSTLDRIFNSIRPRGIFTGTFFGENDTLNSKEYSASVVIEDEIREVFSDFTILSFFEKEKDIISEVNGPIHRHSYHIIARKND